MLSAENRIVKYPTDYPKINVYEGASIISGTGAAICTAVVVA
jgi:hypothetical protein